MIWADTLPSVCASKAMVHCICTFDTLLWHMISYSICDFITDRSIASYQDVFSSIPVEDKLATHEIDY